MASVSVPPASLNSSPRSTPNIEIKIIQDKQNEWRSVLVPWYEFFQNAPLSSTVDAWKTTEGKVFLEGLLDHISKYDDTPWFVAWDTVKDQAAGVIVNRTVYKGLFKGEGKGFIPSLTQLDDVVLQQMKPISQFMGKLEKGYDPFSSLGVDKVLKIEFASVSGEYRNF